MDPAAKTIVIIGAGITGLAAACRLRAKGFDVRLLEAARHAGGLIQTEAAQGYLAELGPNAMLLPGRSAEEFLHETGMAGEMLEPGKQAQKRFLVKNGQVIPAPSGPVSFLTTPLFSPGAKWRLFQEPFIPPAPEGMEESVAGFVRRRLGAEFLNRAAAPLVSGIFAGDPERLSIRYAFPRIWRLERIGGSLLKGALLTMWRNKKEGAPRFRRRLVSFRSGMQALPQKLARLAGESLRTSAAVTAIRRQEKHWRVEWTEGEVFRAAPCAAVLLAVPAHQIRALPLPKEINERMRPLDDIYYPPVSVAVFGGWRKQVRHPLDGYGMLVPAMEKKHILGVLFSSSLFPGRAPERRICLTAFMGGATMPELAQKPPGDVMALARRDLKDLLGFEGEPLFQRYYSWPQAIPQYNLGCGRLLNEMAEIEKDYPGLWLAGSYRGGVGAGSCIESALTLAGKTAAALSSRTADA